MAEPSVVILEEVREKRRRAQQARRLARSISDDKAAQQLEDYAG